MQVVIEEFLLDRSYEYENDNYKLSVYGNYIEQIGEIALETVSGGYSVEQLQQLNFDGGYVAFYLDKKSNNNIIFRSHQDTFSLFYTMVNNVVFFSDQYYLLCQKHKELRWNLNAVSDYLENSWNDICKYDRTPFCEISKVDTWRYIIINDSSREVKQLSWKMIKRNILYRENNLNEFKEKFFGTLDYYLEKIYVNNEKVMFSISSGIDANTLATRYSQLYKDAEVDFATSKIDDITDESQITSSMQKVLPKEIRYIPISIDMEQVDIMKLLADHIEKCLPPRFFNEVSEAIFLRKLKKSGINCLHVNGMGADGLFGEFGNEYQYLFNELMEKQEWEKAKDVLTALKVSFSGGSGMEKGLAALRLCYQLKFGSKLFYCVKSISGTKRRYRILKLKLPKAESNQIQCYEDALNYAGYDGATRALSIASRLENMKLSMPYGGYRFQELKYACDPYIYSNKVNKACLRYAVSDLLPKEILENRVKRGNPGVTLKKAISMGNNKQSIKKYIQEHESVLVDTGELLRKVDGDFEHRDFLALSLLVFENHLKDDYGIKIE